MNWNFDRRIKYEITCYGLWPLIDDTVNSLSLWKQRKNAVLRKLGSLHRSRLRSRIVETQIPIDFSRSEIYTKSLMMELTEN